MDPSGKKPSPPPPPAKKSGLFDNVKKDSKKADFSNVQSSKKADFSNVQSGHSTTAPTPPPAAPPPRQARTYTVVSGDTLWAIAKKHLGEGKRGPEIYDQNKAVIGDNPDRIKPGQVLTIPDNNAPGGKP